MEMLCSNVHLKDERKRKTAYHRRTEWGFLRRDEVNELRGGVHDKIQGPRKDSCETPQNRYRQEKLLSHFTGKGREDR